MPPADKQASFLSYNSRIHPHLKRRHICHLNSIIERHQYAKQNSLFYAELAPKITIVNSLTNLKRCHDSHVKTLHNMIIRTSIRRQLVKNQPIATQITHLLQAAPASPRHVSQPCQSFF
jgi:hypothetical protein